MTGLLRRLMNQEKGRIRRRFVGDPRLANSVASISRKYELDPGLLVDGLVEAYRNKEHHYGVLDITCRETGRGYAVLLLTMRDRVISQFPVKVELLENPAFLNDCIRDASSPRYAKVEALDKHRTISELRFGMKGVSVGAEIVDIPPKRLVTSELGNYHYVSNVKIADETGSIRLSLWNDQIEQVHIKDKIEIENGYVSAFAGEPQLRVSRKGSIVVIKQDGPETLPPG